MAAPALGVCGPWIDTDDVLPPPAGSGCCGGLADPINEVMLQKAIVFATNILFRASGRQFPGECERTVRPCRGAGGSGCGCGCGGGEDGGWGGGPGLGAWGGWNSFWWDTALGGWNSTFPYAVGWLGGCGCGGGCNGCNLPGVLLSNPIASVSEVVINGEIIDPAEYAVEDYRTLARYTLDANGCLLGWPCMNRLSVDSSPYGADPNDGSKDHTWQITYVYGRGPGDDGETAAAMYACELAKLWCNGDGCRLPYRVQTMVREQMTASFVDPSLFLTNGMTGLPEVDAWIRSVNPNGNIRRSTVQRLGRPNRNIRSIT